MSGENGSVGLEAWLEMFLYQLTGCVLAIYLQEVDSSYMM